MAEDAAVLTAIGMGTAFALLVGLLIMVPVLTKASELWTQRFAGEGESRAEREARNKALAATAAVGALLAERESDGTDG